MAAVKASHGSNQTNWVIENLLTNGEREKIRAICAQEQRFAIAQTFQLSLLAEARPCELAQSAPRAGEEVAQSATADIWMAQENLQSIAQDLDNCPDRETLADLRLCWPTTAINAACKLLSPEKHAQLRQWMKKLSGA